MALAWKTILFCWVLSLSIANSLQRNAKALSLFNVVQFPNEACNGTSTTTTGSRLGTCYTTEECNSKGGESSGSCANGYGVCCIFVLQCSSTVAENNTYLIQASSATPSRNPNDPILCTFTIRKSANEVERIRFDFRTFQINPPALGQTENNGVVIDNEQGAIGHCLIDQFSINSAGVTGSPVICGINTGQHVIVDASDAGATATFSFSPQTGLQPREYDILVTQLELGNPMAGPPGCLQYFTADIGNIASFNFDTAAPAVTAKTTHLANQMYNMCFRRNLNKCFICFIPAITRSVANTAVNTQSSFGLSVAPAAAIGESEVESNCMSDYLAIPFGDNLPLENPPDLVNSKSRFCGRVLHIVTGQDSDTVYGANLSVCTNTRPFMVTFFSDATEVGPAGAGASNTHEESVSPGGIIGFNLRFEQRAC